MDLDPGEELHEVAKEVMKGLDKEYSDGRKIEESLVYAKALDIAIRENPELAERYFQSSR